MRDVMTAMFENIPFDCLCRIDARLSFDCATSYEDVYFDRVIVDCTMMYNDDYDVPVAKVLLYNSVEGIIETFCNINLEDGCDCLIHVLDGLRADFFIGGCYDYL